MQLYEGEKSEQNANVFLLSVFDIYITQYGLYLAKCEIKTNIKIKIKCKLKTMNTILIVSIKCTYMEDFKIRQQRLI